MHGVFVKDPLDEAWEEDQKKKSEARAKELLETAKGAFTAGAAFMYSNAYGSATVEMIEKEFTKYWNSVLEIKKRLEG